LNRFEYHPEALDELADAVSYYRDTVSLKVAENFDAVIASAIQEMTRSPQRWPYFEKTPARRIIIRRFPFALFYTATPSIRIIAVAHTSRRPGYWRRRIAVD
jgi:plasmid stabilization system protein ParE